MKMLLNKCFACGYEESYFLPPILSFREFVGEEHWKGMRQYYDESRQYLKNCGKPKDVIDLWFIQYYKETVKQLERYK